MSSKQVTMVSLEELLSQNHQYRKFKELFNFKEIESEFKSVESAAIKSLRQNSKLLN
jgi:hypothetical protein